MNNQQETDHGYLINLELRPLWMHNQNHATQEWLNTHPKYICETNRTLNGPLYELSKAGRKRLAKLDEIFIN